MLLLHTPTHRYAHMLLCCDVYAGLRATVFVHALESYCLVHALETALAHTRHACTNTRARAHARFHSYTPARAHAHVHTHIHTHIHTHTHT